MYRRSYGRRMSRRGMRRTALPVNPPFPAPVPPAGYHLVEAQYAATSTRGTPIYVFQYGKGTSQNFDYFIVTDTRGHVIESDYSGVDSYN